MENKVRNITKAKRLLRRTRAVSPVIATLLLVAIGVAASVITYSWVMGMLSGTSTQAGTSIRIDLVEFKIGTQAMPISGDRPLETILTLGADSTINKGSTLLSGTLIKATSNVLADHTVPTNGIISITDAKLMISQGSTFLIRATTPRLSKSPTTPSLP